MHLQIKQIPGSNRFDISLVNDKGETIIDESVTPSEVMTYLKAIAKAIPQIISGLPFLHLIKPKAPPTQNDK